MFSETERHKSWLVRAVGINIIATNGDLECYHIQIRPKLKVLVFDTLLHLDDTTRNADRHENLDPYHKTQERVENSVHETRVSSGDPLRYQNTRCGTISRSAASKIFNEGFFSPSLPPCVCVLYSLRPSPQELLGNTAQHLCKETRAWWGPDFHFSLSLLSSCVIRSV